MSRVSSCVLAGLVFWAALAVSGGNCAAESPYQGPSTLAASRDGRTLYVASSDARQVAWVDTASRRTIRRVPVPAEPTGVAISPDGTTLYVTCAAPKSTVAVIDAASGRIRAKLPAGHTAMAPVVAPDGRWLYVCNRFNNSISVFDLETGQQKARVAAVREPIAAALSPDGKWLLVANLLPDDAPDSFYAAAAVNFVDTRSLEASTVRLPNGATHVRGICLSPDGKHAFVTHVLSNFDLVPSQVEGGWTNMNALSVLDVATRRLVHTVTLDDMLLGAANPWGVACSSDGRWLCVAHAGTHELSVIQLPELLGRIARRAVSPTAGGTPHSPGLLPGLRRRIPLRGNGPRGLAIAGSSVYVAEYFSDTLGCVNLREVERARAESIPLGPVPQLSIRRRGEMLFGDARLCYQQWQSCASCHPDARVDGLNWDLLNDGLGNPKNTKSMFLAHATPPSMSLGVRATGEIAVRAGLTHILFAEYREEDASAIDEYLKALEAPPSPYLVDGRLSAAAERGRRLFESDRIGCARCHPAPLYTDLKMHDVQSRGPYDEQSRFDTPTLREVWRTAPYLHDGRYVSLEELLTRGKHGGAKAIEGMSAGEMRDLVEFVLSL